MEKDSILVIEDEAIVAMDISNTLESVGYNVLSWIKSGEEALEFLKERRPDLILMDIKLKGELDGIQTADQIRNLYNLPVIFLTAFSDKETLDRAKLSLPYGYITKSYNINDLRSTIEMALYKHRMEKKLHEQQQVMDVSLNNIEAAVITADRDGKVRFINRAAEKLLGVTDQARVIGAPIDALGFVLSCGGGERKRPSQLLEEKNIPRRLRCTCLSGSMEEGVPAEIHIHGYGNTRGEVLGYVYVLRDTREEIRFYDVQSRLASIVEFSDDAIISLSLDGTILSWNNAATRMFGYSSKEVIGKNFIILTPAFLPDFFPELLDKMREGKHIDPFETIRKRKDEGFLHVSIMLSPIRNREGVLNGVSVIARDITEKRNLEASILEITEKERIRMGQDLHDSLGQHLTGIMLNMKILENDLKKTGPQQAFEASQNIAALIRDAIQKTRDLAKNLAPPIIESEGIREALRSLVSTVEDLHGFEAVLKIDPTHREPDTVIALQLYRIAQEAVNNALKHSGGSLITVELSGSESELNLVVSDNGKGLDETPSGGMGISIMQYRADMINGTITIGRGSSGGARVSCRIPLHKEST